MKWLALAVGAFLFSAASAEAATLYIEEYASGVSQVGTTQAQIPPAPALADQTVALSGSSAQSSPFNAKTHAISLICDEGCSILIGSNPTAATTNFLLQQGVQVRFGVSPGQVIAAIANPAGNGGGGSGTPGGSPTQVQYNNGGAFGGITGATSNGTVLTLTAPVLGTPASGNLVNTTGYLASALTGAVPVPVDAQTGASYTVLSTDIGGIVTLNRATAVAVTLPQAIGSFGAGSAILFEDIGAGTATITPTTSTIDGSANLALTTGQGVILISDGTNYTSMRGIGGVSNPLTLTRLLTITQGTANEGILASTGYSLTGANAQNMLDLAGTWNTSGNPVALKIAMTNTASGATSKLLSFLTGVAGATEVLKVDVNGRLTSLGAGALAGYYFNDGAGWTQRANGFTLMTLYVGGAPVVEFDSGAAGFLGLNATTYPDGYTMAPVNVYQPDVYFTRRGAGNWQFGAIDAAAPVAQISSVQSVIAGTTNTAGADWTHVGSLSTGSGAAGKIKFALSQISAGATAQNASTVVLSLNTITASGIQFPTYGAGALSTDASGNITATSDERLKDVIGHFNAGLAELEKIQPIVYRWTRASGMETEHEYAGLGAGNVRDAIPEAVGQTSDGYLTLSDRAIIAAEINAIKTLAGELSAVKAEQMRMEQHLWYMEMKR